MSVAYFDELYGSVLQENRFGVRFVAARNFPKDSLEGLVLTCARWFVSCVQRQHTPLKPHKFHNQVLPVFVLKVIHGES